MILTAAIYFPSKGGEKQRKIDCIVYEGKKRYWWKHWCELTQIGQHLAHHTLKVFSQVQHWPRPCPNFCCHCSISPHRCWKHPLFLTQSLALGKSSEKPSTGSDSNEIGRINTPRKRKLPSFPKVSLSF